ncbi:maleylpyruvate isomerase mycothiol-dependent enzyme family protein [Micromonospora auratinigra]|uniref:hypothetical protein n=1 Tax=Micromonospora auratinigra TaxID=261654 RepID=UPI001E3BA469|nr:hypothetical protein [Micromonospora auratinigra]
MTADDLDAAVSDVVAALRPATSLNWSVRAGDLEWDCWHTAEHLGDCLLSFAGQLVARPGDRFVRFMATADQDAAPAEMLEFVEVAGRLLAAAVRMTSSDVRAFHPAGLSDPAGFAAMGCVETLLHGEDIARGLGRSLDPPRDVCARILARLFPQAAHEVTGVDPWAALRWCTGRIELPGRTRLSEWQWHAAPEAVGLHRQGLPA